MKKHPKKTKKLITHDQWIDITRENGQTVTTFYPPNNEFERLRQKMDPPPDLIYRRLNFMHGVPSEYRWTEPPPDGQLYGGHALLRLKPEDWSTAMAMEFLTGNKHVFPGSKLQPRPEQFGPCPCARCTGKREGDYQHS